MNKNLAQKKYTSVRILSLLDLIILQHDKQVDCIPSLIKILIHRHDDSPILMNIEEQGQSQAITFDERHLFALPQRLWFPFLRFHGCRFAYYFLIYIFESAYLYIYTYIFFTRVYIHIYIHIIYLSIYII